MTCVTTTPSARYRATRTIIAPPNIEDVFERSLDHYTNSTHCRLVHARFDSTLIKQRNTFLDMQLASARF
jgi:hypothetical protein